MTYCERYAAGEHVQVWNELSALGDAVRGADLLADAVSVARMTAGEDERRCFPVRIYSELISARCEAIEAPYSIRLPDLGADGALHDEWHNVTFVQYLRIAILEWGGFPGLSRDNPCAKWRDQPVDRATLARVTELTKDLVSF